MYSVKTTNELSMCLMCFEWFNYLKLTLR